MPYEAISLEEYKRRAEKLRPLDFGGTWTEDAGRCDRPCAGHIGCLLAARGDLF